MPIRKILGSIVLQGLSYHSNSVFVCLLLFVKLYLLLFHHCPRWNFSKWIYFAGLPFLSLHLRKYSVWGWIVLNCSLTSYLRIFRVFQYYFILSVMPNLTYFRIVCRLFLKLIALNLCLTTINCLNSVEIYRCAFVWSHLFLLLKIVRCSHLIISSFDTWFILNF